MGLFEVYFKIKDPVLPNCTQIILVGALLGPMLHLTDPTLDVALQACLQLVLLRLFLNKWYLVRLISGLIWLRKYPATTNTWDYEFDIHYYFVLMTILNKNSKNREVWMFSFAVRTFKAININRQMSWKNCCARVNFCWLG